MSRSLPLAVAVIVDLSKSRQHPDRAELQRGVRGAFDRVNGVVRAEQNLEPTIGDEFQAVYADLPTALRATLLARLELPEGADCRFGLGFGEVHSVGESNFGAVQDGSAWWSAREAIDEAREREYSRLSFVRTWFAAAEEQSAGTGTVKLQRHPGSSLVNAYLLCRDQLLSGMSPRARRLLLGQLIGVNQAELAHQEGITQSAVSQNLRKSGAVALLAAETLLLEEIS